MKVSFSAMSKYLQCEGSYWFKYGLGLRPIAALAGTEVGSITHHALEVILIAHAFGKPLPDYRDAVREGCANMRERKRLTDDSEENAEIAIAALEYHVPKMDLDQWETLILDGKPGVELELEVTFAGAKLCAHIDWVARSRVSGKVFIIDHKTTKHRLGEQPYEYHGLQLALYRHAYNIEAEKRGWPLADGAMLHQMSTATPAMPERLKKKAKDGRCFSKAVSQRTTREVFTRALSEANEPIRPYLDLLNHLDDSEAKRPFRRWTPDVSSEEGHAAMIAIARRAVHEMREVKERSRLPVFSRVSEWTCGRCENRALCDAQMLGYDLRSLVLSVYTPDDDSVFADDVDTEDSRALDMHIARVSHTKRFNVHTWSPHKP